MPAKHDQRMLGRWPSTIWDVARDAGVSVSTVSKALNGRGQLRAETRSLVQSAAARLNFRPNNLAQALLRKRSFTVGLISTDSHGRFSIPLLQGIEDALEAAQISVFLCTAADDLARERQHVSSLLAKRVDGIIVTGRRIDPRPPIAPGLPVPVVYVMTQSENPDDVSFIPDDGHGGQLAVSHLVTSGRRKIAHVTGPQRFLAARLRAAAAQEVLAAAGLPLAAGQVLYGEWGEEWGRQAAHTVLHNEPEADAIFCGSDQIARGVADALREAGRRVPDDIALVGYDNWELFAATCRPPLTTVDMCLRDLGQLAARTLLADIDGQPAHGVQRLPGRLIIRESSGAARQA